MVHAGGSLMSEARLWSYLRDGVGGLWEAERIENRLNSGVPDVAYSTDHHGWIELKYLPKAPKRSDTALKIDHYTAEQKNWLTKHGKRGGHCFLFLQVGGTYMLFGSEAARDIGTVTLDAHKKMALAVWEGQVCFTEFVRLLSRG